MAVKAMFDSLRSVLSLLKKKEDVFGKGGAAIGNKILCGHRKHSYRDSQISEAVGKT